MVLSVSDEAKIDRLVTVLGFHSEKIHSVRYDSPFGRNAFKEGEPIQSLYLEKSEVEALGSPRQIRITIEAEEEGSCRSPSSG